MTNEETITAREFITGLFNTDFLMPNELTTLVAAMSLFAKGKCKEQREICSRLVSGWPNVIKTESEIEDDILYAPEPIFD
mgnify:CR=1 FL=1